MALTQYTVGENLLDDGTYVLPTGRGWGRALIGDGEAFVFFRQDTNGKITIINSINFATSDLDGWSCIYDSGVSGTIKNRLGIDNDLLMEFYLGDGADTLADDGTEKLPTGPFIGITAMVGDDDHFLHGYKRANNRPTIVTATANIGDPGTLGTNDPDDHFNIKTVGGPSLDPVLKNRLGSVQVLEYFPNESFTTSIGTPAAHTVTGPGWFKVGIVGNMAVGHGYAEGFYNAAGDITWISSDANIIEGATSGFLRIYTSAAGEISIINNTTSTIPLIYYQFIEAAALAISDTSVSTDPWIDDLTKLNVGIGFTRNPGGTWGYCTLDRRVNGGAWHFLKDDGTWAVTGSKWEFDAATSTGELSWTDVDVSDSKYEYRCKQVTSGGIESVGLQTEEFVDEPKMAIAIQGTGTTTIRAIQVAIDGNSGDDSGNEQGKVYKFLLYAADEPAANGIEYLVRASDLPVTVSFYINTAEGRKTINCYGYDKAGQAGTLVTDTVIMALTTPTETAANLGKIMFGYNAISDQGATPLSSSNLSGFVTNNVRDQRPGVVWLGESIDDVSGGLSANYHVWFDLVGVKTIDIFYLVNHNLNSALLTGAVFYLCATNVDPSGWYSVDWLSTAAYKVELTNALGRQTIVHRPEVSYRYWAVVTTVTVANAANAQAFTPLFGRIGLVRSSDIFQPASGDFRDAFTQEIVDSSVMIETDDGILEAADKDTHDLLTLTFPKMTSTDYSTARQVLGREVKKSRGIIVLPRPDEIPVGTDEPTLADEFTVEPIYCQLAKNTVLKSRQAGKMDFAVLLREMIGENGVDD